MRAPAASAIAVACGTPMPSTPRLVHAWPGPTPTRTPTAPVRMRCSAVEYDAQPPTITGMSNSRMNFLRLSGCALVLRHVLGRHDRALDDEDVELGLEHVLRVLLDALRRERRARRDARVLDLADALADQLVLDRLGVDLLHAARRLLGRQLGDLLEERLGILVARPEAFEVQAREAAELADLDRGARARRRRPSPRR